MSSPFPNSERQPESGAGNEPSSRPLQSVLRSDASPADNAAAYPRASQSASQPSTARTSRRTLFWLGGGLLAVLIFGCLATTAVGFTFFSRGDSSRTASASRAQVVSRESNANLGVPAAQVTSQPLTLVATPESGVDYETAALINLYEQVNQSVVNIAIFGTTADLGNLHSGLPGQPEVLPPGQPTPDFGLSGLGDDVLLPFSGGSGFVWDMDGHIVTNNHVVEGAGEVQVTFPDGTLAVADVVGTDISSDLAVIKINPRGYNLVPVRHGDMAAVRPGIRVAAIGNPFGLESTLTSGIVSAIGRSIQAENLFSIPESIQTDAAINPGNSGGPLLNEQGEVIGVNAQISSATGSNSGVGFAIPISLVERVVPALIETGKYEHAYIGFGADRNGSTLSPICANEFGLPPTTRGAVIGVVYPNTPAAKARLRGATERIEGRYSVICPASGGDIVTGIDGQPVTQFDDILIYLERYTSPGDTVIFTILRDGAERQVDVTLAARPERVSR